MNIVAHNLAAMNANRQLGIVNTRNAKSMEKLSSGYKINRAADDAAGLSISEKMRKQIRGLNRGTLNAEDGVSFCQVADGALNEVTDILQRINELSIKAANGTCSSSDRQAIDDEVQQLKKETRRIFSTTRFNETQIFEDEGEEVIFNMNDVRVNYEDVQIFSSGLDTNGNLIYGGIEVNDVRHTWEEMGVKLTDDGKYFKEDQVISFNDYKGELVELHIKGGDPLNNVTRKNRWEAKTDGVYINDVLAQTWGDIEKVDLGEAFRFTVKHKGQEVTFTATSDQPSALMKKINGRNTEDRYTWDFSTSGQTSGGAINLANANTIRITEANKGTLMDASYQVSVYGTGDNGGITITSSDGASHSKTAWKNFVNTSSGSAYPITDWGLQNLDGKGTDSDNVTFDDTAVYKYTDTANPNMGISFEFTLADEAGYDEVKNAIDGVTLTKRISAPNRMSANASSGSTSVSASLTGSLSFETQRAYGRDFNDANDTMTGTIQRTLHTDSGPTTSYSGITEGAVTSRDNTVYTDDYYYLHTDGYYYKVVRTKTQFTETEQGERTRIDAYAAHYSYDDPKFNGTDLNSLANTDSFTYYQNYDESMERTRTGERIAYGDPDYTSTGLTYSEIVALGAQTATVTDLTATTSYQDWSAWNLESSTANGGKYKTDNLSNSLRLESSKGLIGSMQVRDNGRGIGDATLNINFTATDYATAAFSVSARGASSGNRSNHIVMQDITLNPPDESLPMKDLILHVGPDTKDKIDLRWTALNNAVLGIVGTNTRTERDAELAIGEAGNAIKIVSMTRSLFGAQQNRIEHTIAQNNNTSENTQAAESRIRDTDMAKEMVSHSKDSILLQAGQAMLSQANQATQGVLTLLR